MDGGTAVQAPPAGQQSGFFHMPKLQGPKLQVPKFYHLPKVEPADSAQSTAATTTTNPAELRGRTISGPNRYNNREEGKVGGSFFDGKQMRKSVIRKTVDYNTTVVKYLENRIWQRDGRDARAIQPDSLYQFEMTPPCDMKEQPMNCLTTKFMRQSTNKFRCPIFCLAWTTEGRRLVTGASSGEFTLWNGLTFSFETILQAHETSVRAMVWSHNDQWMVTADHAGYIKYWQSNMNNVKMYQGHKEPIRSISFCPTDSKFASCSDDGTVRIWDFMRCHEEKILRGHGADVKCVDWHPQKSIIASGSKDNQVPIKLWDPKSGQSLATLHAHKFTVMDLKWNKNGQYLLTAARDHLMKLFDIRNMKEEVQIFKGHKKEATAVAWHPINEQMFASGGSDGAIMFWNCGTDKEVGAMEEAHDAIIWDLAWHPLGHVLASASNDHSTKFWTRNRPGDAMRDKYNLNLMPVGPDGEILDVDADILTGEGKSLLPGMGLEHGLPPPDPEPIKKVVDELPCIPGLNWSEDVQYLKEQQIREMPQRKKVAYSRPIPRSFEQAWITNQQPGTLVRDEDDEGNEKGPRRRREKIKSLLSLEIPMKPPPGLEYVDLGLEEEDRQFRRRKRNYQDGHDGPPDKPRDAPPRQEEPRPPDIPGLDGQHPPGIPQGAGMPQGPSGMPQGPSGMPQGPEVSQGAGIPFGMPQGPGMQQGPPGMHSGPSGIPQGPGMHQGPPGMQQGPGMQGPPGMQQGPGMQGPPGMQQGPGMPPNQDIHGGDVDLRLQGGPQAPHGDQDYRGNMDRHGDQNMRDDQDYRMNPNFQGEDRDFRQGQGHFQGDPRNNMNNFGPGGQGEPPGGHRGKGRGNYNNFDEMEHENYNKGDFDHRNNSDRGRGQGRDNFGDHGNQQMGSQDNDPSHERHPLEIARDAEEMMDYEQDRRDRSPSPGPGSDRNWGRGRGNSDHGNRGRRDDGFRGGREGGYRGKDMDNWRGGRGRGNDGGGFRGRGRGRKNDDDKNDSFEGSQEEDGEKDQSGDGFRGRGGRGGRGGYRGGRGGDRGGRYRGRGPRRGARGGRGN